MEVERRVRSALSGAGFDEVVNYSFVDPAILPWVTPRALEKLGTSVEAVALKNPLTPQQAVMRTTLLASLLPNVAFNLRQQPESLRLYEIGRAYLRDPQGGKDLRPVAEERLHVAGVLWGRRDPKSWTSKDEPNDFADARGAVEAMVSALSGGEVTCRLGRVAPFHPRATAEARVGDTVLGWLGEVHPLVAEHLELPRGVFAFELEFGALERVAALSPQFRAAAALSGGAPRRGGGGAGHDGGGRGARRHPRSGPAAGRGRDAVRRLHRPTLAQGQKNLAFALRYRAPDRTLRDDEVATAHARIVEEVQRRLGGQLRGR